MIAEKEPREGRTATPSGDAPVGAQVRNSRAKKAR